MNKDILISVVVPVYNCENYLEECIKSILSQSFKSFELILINDGSTDSSLEICKKISKLDNRILIVNQNNIGVSKTRKKGIELSKGRYICFIDSDDYIEKDYLKVLYQNIQDKNLDIVCCNSKNIGETSIKPINIKKDEIILDKKRIYNDYFLKYRYTCTLWGKLFKREIINDIEFPKMRYAEDTYLMLKIFNTINAIKIIKYDGYNYRIQSESASSTINEYLKLIDVLKRDELAYQICKKYDYNLINLSLIRYIDDLYGLVVSYFCVKNLEEKKKIYENISNYYKFIKEYANVNKIKLFIIKVFLFNKNIAKLIVNFINMFKKKGG